MQYEMEELLPIVSELAEKYTSGESTSITWEKAQMLMEAVLYCLEEYDLACPGTDDCNAKGSRGDQNMSAAAGSLAGGISVRERYKRGRALVFEKVSGIRKIFNELAGWFEDYGVRCLHDTVRKGIPEFLKWYDFAFCPQDTILTLDYPLFIDVTALRGADAVYRYICGIRTEQRFLGRFDRSYVMRVLEKYDPEYQDMVENICGIVLPGIIGHMALRKPLNEAGFGMQEYAGLCAIFEGKSIPDIKNTVEYFISGMVNQFYGKNEEMLTYLCHEAENISVRIDTAVRYGQPDKIFLL